MIYFEWDDAKDAYNLKEHGISFSDACPVFEDPYRITEEDSVVAGEQRWRTVGMANGIAVLLVVHLEEADGHNLFVRMISARKATPGERSDYEQSRAEDIE